MGGNPIEETAPDATRSGTKGTDGSYVLSHNGNSWNDTSRIFASVRSFQYLPRADNETTAKGTGLEESAGKEDPVELDSSLTL